jgi:ribonuclease HI
MAKNNYYVVFIGRIPGIYHSWVECEYQTKGYSGSSYKGYISLDDAKTAFRKFNNSIPDNKDSKLKEAFSKNSEVEEIDYNTISVDGACAGNPGLGEYQCVHTQTGEQIFIESGFEDTTNNIMEFLALVQAIKYVTENKVDTKIYSDSITAMAWVRNKKANSNLRATKRNFDSKQMMDEAEKWLKENTYTVEILKWHTKKWGEIPADFGRK